MSNIPIERRLSQLDDGALLEITLRGRSGEVGIRTGYYVSHAPSSSDGRSFTVTSFSLYPQADYNPASDSLITRKSIDSPPVSISDVTSLTVVKTADVVKENLKRLIALEYLYKK
jgi:hypothetical protein